MGNSNRNVGGGGPRAIRHSLPHRLAMRVRYSVTDFASRFMRSRHRGLGRKPRQSSWRAWRPVSRHSVSLTIPERTAALARRWGWTHVPLAATPPLPSLPTHSCCTVLIVSVPTETETHRPRRVVALQDCGTAPLPIHRPGVSPVHMPVVRPQLSLALKQLGHPSVLPRAPNATHHVSPACAHLPRCQPRQEPSAVPTLAARYLRLPTPPSSTSDP